MRRAICLRAVSTASSAAQPNAWFRLAALPNFSIKYGSIASRTRGSMGVVEWLSKKIGNFIVQLLVLSGTDRNQRRAAQHVLKCHTIEQLMDAVLHFQ